MELITRYPELPTTLFIQLSWWRGGGNWYTLLEPRMRFPLDPGSQGSCLELCATEGLPGALLRHYLPTWPEVKRAKAMWLLRVHARRNLDQSHHSWAGVSTQGGKTKCICHRKGETSLVTQMVKHLPTMWETWVWSLGREDPLEKETVTHSSTLAWKIPWTEQCGRLQSMRLQSRTRLSDFTLFLFFYPRHLKCS